MNRKKSIYLLIFLIILSAFAALFAYQPAWSKYSSFRPWRLGLDIAGGTMLTYKVDLSDVDSASKESVVEGLRDVLERRVNIFGVSEPEVYIQSSEDQYRIIIELAGIKDINEAIKEIGETPLLEFKEVEGNINNFGADLDFSTSTESSATSSLNIKEETSASTSTIAQGTSTSSGSQIRFIDTKLTGRFVEGAFLQFDQVTNQPFIGLELTDKGGDIFEDLTARNVGKPIAILLDGEVIEMPVVQERIPGGNARITGNFTVDEARKVVQRFNAGALPAPIELINQYTISPDLGHNSLDLSIKAGIIGLMLVILYMIIFYRKLGLFASLALLMYVSLLLAIFKLVPITLTLAGIAGAILSIGMAVDANVLVFERIKEELKKGVKYKVAVEEGFRRAWNSIRDSNITTIISSVILYYLTSSFVRGFALALLVGVLISMFSAITITRTILRVFLSKEKENQSDN